MGGRGKSWIAGGRALFFAGAALAWPSAAAAGKPEAEQTKPAREPVELRMAIGQRGPGFPWVLRLDNASSEPLRVVADPRLLWFEAEVAGKKKPEECELPSSMKPKGPAPEAITVLEPGDRVIRTFDPRFFCFSETEQEVLIPGTKLQSHYGWPSKTKKYWKRGKRVVEKLPDTAPFIAEPIRPESTAAPLKNLEGNVITLDDRYRVWKEEEDDKDDAGDKDGPEPDPMLELSIVRGQDAYSERSVTLTVTLENPSKEQMYVFFRRELITFEVLGPEGLVECRAKPDERAPARQAFMNMRSGRKSRIVSRLVELCPRGTFSRPGFYLIHARFDAKEDGKDFDLHAFTGTVHTKRPVTVRVQTGEEAFFFRPGPPKPKAEGAAGEEDAKPGSQKAGAKEKSGSGAPKGASAPKEKKR